MTPKVDRMLARAIGARVRELRLAQGWTQLQLAIRIDGYRPVISRIEAGARMPMVQTLAAIARAFGMSLSTLLEGVDGVPAACAERRSA